MDIAKEPVAWYNVIACYDFLILYAFSGYPKIVLQTGLAQREATAMR